jgi:hypothetical protein
MKRHLFILMAICLGGLMAISCDRENGDDNGGSGTSGDKKITIQYQMKDHFTQNGQQLQISPYFHYNLKYVDATGKTVEVNNVSAPWTLPAFEVKAPFTAKIEGTIVYNESELPETDTIIIGAVPNIHYTENGVVKDCELNDAPVGQFSSKAQFLNFISTHPDRLEFTLEHTF